MESIELIGFSIPRDVNNILIKPNMCYYWDYSTGETTDPRFVKALVDVLRSQTSRRVKIAVVESDASAMKCEYAFRFLGFEKMTRENGLDLINLSREKNEEVRVSIGAKTFRFKLPEIIRDADLKVNVPKIKYQMFTKISCALKNIYGCNPYPKKFRYHPILDEVIVALNKIMRFDLCVVDGIVTSGSQPTRLGLAMAGIDPVAIDAAASRLLRINPSSVRHIMLAQREGLGDISSVIRGETLDYFKKRLPRRSAKSEVMEFGYKLVTMIGLDNRLGL